MNEINEIKPDCCVSPTQAQIFGGLAMEMETQSIKDVVSDYLSELNDFANESYESASDFAHDLTETICEALGINDTVEGVGTTDKIGEYHHDAAREYGLQECAESAKEIFTPEVINGWNQMNVETRNDIIQQYAEAIGKGLNINMTGIIWENFPIENGRYTYGYNAGDGYIHLNSDFLTNPSMVISLIDTIAHEARHQFQTEAIENPDKFGIDIATINEWRAGKEEYTLEMPSAYDPWGYTYNPLELDSQYFGQTIVRELTKDIINS